jgi:hypothetical protein
MTFRLSTGLRNQLNKNGSIDRLFRGGRIEIYTGVQPSSPDAAVTGTLLCTITNNSGSLTPESAAVGTATFAGSAGSVNTLTVNGVDLLQGNPQAFSSTLQNTINNIATQINRNSDVTGYNAVASTTTAGLVTIYGNAGQGATPNGYTVTATLTTMTATYTNMSGGVNSANGLQFDVAAGGTMTQLATQIWSGLNGNTGTAGWFRQYGALNDTGALDTNFQYSRMDGAVATSGAEMNLSSTAFTAGATTTISGWSLTVPPQ